MKLESATKSTYYLDMRTGIHDCSMKNVVDLKEGEKKGNSYAVGW